MHSGISGDHSPSVLNPAGLLEARGGDRGFNIPKI
jgi:hypothetical protein